jgi:hypothetical protein
VITHFTWHAAKRAQDVVPASLLRSWMKVCALAAQFLPKTE